MKIIALNGSARKNWNDGQMLERFIQGIHFVDESIKVKRVDVFDLDYKGCRGCLGCQLKKTTEVGCVVKDGAHALLKEIRVADGLVFATPIYFMEISAQLRALFERLFYPGFGTPPPEGLSVSAIYTMNQPQEVMEKLFRHPIDVMRRYFKELFQAEVDEVFAFQTLQWKNNELYRFSDEFYRERVRIHEQQWDKDLQNAFAAGARLAKRVMQKKAATGEREE